MNQGGAETLPTKLHLGCGLTTPEGWLNVDGSWSARLSKYRLVQRCLFWMKILPKSVVERPWDAKRIFLHDLRKPLPFSSNNFEAIYTSHTLEHLYLDEARRLLKECLRVLRPLGVLRVVVPDLRSIVREYLGEITLNHRNYEIVPVGRADLLNYRLGLRPASPPLSFSGLIKIVFADYSHKWMYDSESLMRYFEWSGFQEIQERCFCDSKIDKIEIIESAGRMLGGHGICVEGVKPL